MVAELLGSNPTFDGVLLEAIRRAGGRPVAVLLDETHTIAEWPSAAQRALNVVLRDSGQIGVVVVSSERLGLKGRERGDHPLSFVGYPLQLPPIDIDSWCSGLRERFSQLEIEADRESLMRLVTEAQRHPYCTMRLAAESARLAEYERVLTSSASASLSDTIIAAALITVCEDPVWQQVVR